MLEILFVIGISIAALAIGVGILRNNEHEERRPTNTYNTRTEHPEAFSENTEYIMKEYGLGKDTAEKVADGFDGYLVSDIVETYGKAMQEIAVYMSAIDGVATSGSDCGLIIDYDNIKPGLRKISDIINENVSKEELDKRIDEYKNRLKLDNAIITAEGTEKIERFKKRYFEIMDETGGKFIGDQNKELEGLENTIRRCNKKTDGNAYITEGALTFETITENMKKNIMQLFDRMKYSCLKPEFISFNEEKKYAVILTYTGQNKAKESMAFEYPRGRELETKRGDAEIYIEESNNFWKSFAEFTKEQYEKSLRLQT